MSVIPESAFGSLSVLNCGEGDIKIAFDKENPIDVARAERIVLDMLKRGYMLFVQTPDGKVVRATGFDASTKEYIIGGDPMVIVSQGEGEIGGDQKNSEGEGSGDQEKGASAEKAPVGSARKSTKPGKRRLPMAKTKATGVAPTAGG